MTNIVRKMIAFFGPKDHKGRQPRRSRSSTPESYGKSLRSKTQSPGETPPEGSVKSKSSSNSNLLLRLKSWFERTKAVAPEGFFSVDVGMEKKIHYLIPIEYLSHEDLQKLLDDSVAEFGHSYSGPLQLACEEEELLEVLDSIRSSYEGEKEEDCQHLILHKNKNS